MNASLWEQLRTLSIQEPKSLEQMALKLSEESGEVAEAVLASSDASGSEYKQASQNHIDEECIDVILVAAAMFYQSGHDPAHMEELLQKKMEKWRTHMAKREV